MPHGDSAVEGAPDLSTEAYSRLPGTTVGPSITGPQQPTVAGLSYPGRLQGQVAG